MECPELPVSIQEEILHLAGRLPISYRLRHKLPPKRLTSLPTINVCAAQIEMIRYRKYSFLDDHVPETSTMLRARHFARHNGIEYSHHYDASICHAEIHEAFRSQAWDLWGIVEPF